MPASNRNGDSLDPVYVNSRREALAILAVWAGCLVWTLGYSWWAGYREPTGEVATVLGVPSWVMWGVMVPWIVAGLITVCFGLFVISDDPLGDEDDAPHTDADEAAGAPHG